MKSHSIDTALLRDNYRQLTDQELIRRATEDAAGLTPQALQVIKQEIESRNLDVKLIQNLETQNQQISIEELDQYCELIRQLNCPVCGHNTAPLNATVTSEVMSFIIITNYNKKLKIACPGCLDKANNTALMTTALLGWWGFPWGLIRSVQAIINNVKSKKSNKLETPNNYLRSFTLHNIGHLEVHRNDRQKLQQLLSGTSA